MRITYELNATELTPEWLQSLQLLLGEHRLAIEIQVLDEFTETEPTLPVNPPEDRQRIQAAMDRIKQSLSGDSSVKMIYMTEDDMMGMVNNTEK